MLRLGGEVRLGEALLRLGGSKSSETQASGSHRRGFLCLGIERRIFHKWVVSSFSLEICQPKPKQSKTTLKSDLSQPKIHIRE